MKSAYIDGLAPRRSKVVSQNSKSTTAVFKKNMTNPLPRKKSNVKKIVDQKSLELRLYRMSQK